MEALSSTKRGKISPFLDWLKKHFSGKQREQCYVHKQQKEKDKEQKEKELDVEQGKPEEEEDEPELEEEEQEKVEEEPTQGEEEESEELEPEEKAPTSICSLYFFNVRSGKSSFTKNCCQPVR